MALSSYRNLILSDCRRDGWSSLEGIANLQELYFFNSQAYAASIVDLGAADTSPNGNYKLETNWIGDDVFSYRVTATPLAESKCVGRDNYSFRLLHTGLREHSTGKGWKQGWKDSD